MSSNEFNLGAINEKPTPAGVPENSTPRGSSKGHPSGAAQKYAAKGLEFYTMHTVGKTPEGQKPNYQISKFDQDLNVLSGPYNLSYIPSNNGGYYDCNCPASKFDCRHKSIMVDMIRTGAVDSGKYYCFQTKTLKSGEEI